MSIVADDSKINRVFGKQIRREVVLNMCGGCAEWWNYVFVFDDCRDFDLFVESATGREFVQDSAGNTIYYNPENEEIILDAYDDDENLTEDCFRVDYDFFFQD